MRFATLTINGSEQACIRHGDDLWMPLNRISSEYEGDLLALIRLGLPKGDMESLGRRAHQLGSSVGIHTNDARFCPPYRHPRKIWGIGLNYGDHAGDLEESAPEQPASFIKGDHTIIGHGDAIILPEQSKRTTAEAELGLIMGQIRGSVAKNDALDSVFGVCAILDQTAEDILRLNPRFLTRAKNFSTFFSFGPEVVTLDEFTSERSLETIEVATYMDGKQVRRNAVANMTHSPASLVSFHSQMMPFYPGDIISTGTPGAGVLQPGANVEARIDGLLPLSNTVAS